jgi:hypothetical protein
VRRSVENERIARTDLGSHVLDGAGETGWSRLGIKNLSRPDVTVEAACSFRSFFCEARGVANSEAELGERELVGPAGRRPALIDVVVDPDRRMGSLDLMLSPADLYVSVIRPGSDASRLRLL